MFLDPSQFEFVSALEAQWRLIRDEYLALPSKLFDPWVQRDMHGGGWTVFGLFALGGERLPIAPGSRRSTRLPPASCRGDAHLAGGALLDL
jgi:hypothetical protein